MAAIASSVPPNDSLEPTRYGRRRLAAPGHRGHRPSAVRQQSVFSRPEVLAYNMDSAIGEANGRSEMPAPSQSEVPKEQVARQSYGDGRPISKSRHGSAIDRGLDRRANKIAWPDADRSETPSLVADETAFPGTDELAGVLAASTVGEVVDDELDRIERGRAPAPGHHRGMDPIEAEILARLAIRRAQRTSRAWLRLLSRPDPRDPRPRTSRSTGHRDDSSRRYSGP